MPRPRPARALLVAALLGLLLGAALLAPPALAQKPRPVLELRVDPALATLAPGERATVEVEVRYVGAVPESGSLSLRHSLEGTVSWASFTVEPAEETVPAAGQREVHARFRVVVRVADHAIPGSTAELPIVTRAEGTLAHAAGEGSASLTLQVRGNATAGGGGNGGSNAYASSPPAPAVATQPTPVTPGASYDAPRFVWPRGEPDVRVQSRHDEDLRGGEWLVVALGGAAGAYAGLRLWRRTL